MSKEKRPRCLVNKCFCCTPETASKIIGYLGAIGSTIYIILGFTALILLSIGQAETSTIDTPTASETNNGNDDSNVSVADYITNSLTGGNLVAAFILVVFTILVYLQVLGLNVVLLIGLKKKRPKYVKIFLISSIIYLVLALVVGAVSLIATYSTISIINIVYLHFPLYTLMVIRTAYYNMKETSAAVNDDID